MTKVNAAMVLAKLTGLSGRYSMRILTSVVLGAGLVACASSPTAPAVQTAPARVTEQGLASASAMYDKRDYAAALSEFDKVIAKEASSANNRRLAYLGKALIYLGNEESWHNLENAKLALNDASKVKTGPDEKFNIETGMFMDAILALAGSQSAYDALQTKTGGSGAQASQLKKQRDALITERDALLEEQARLNEALERLKELTLGD